GARNQNPETFYSTHKRLHSIREQELADDDFNPLVCTDSALRRVSCSYTYTGVSRSGSCLLRLLNTNISENNFNFASCYYHCLPGRSMTSCSHVAEI
ncbi:hypothetical protein T310_8722, partial [Rasamsonia emersonii CBS 393.64]